MNYLIKKNTFWYIVLSIVILYVFSNLNLGTNILIGILVIYQLVDSNENRIKDEENNKTMLENKIIENIMPKTTFNREYREINEFLFINQDLYVYNPPSYEHMVDTINSFFMIYDDVKNNNNLANNAHNDLVILKKTALNSLHSLIFKLPSNKNIEQKLNIALTNLDTLLNKYIIDVRHISNKITPNNINRTVLSDYPEPKNMYDNDMFENPLRKQIYSYDKF